MLSNREQRCERPKLQIWRNVFEKNRIEYFFEADLIFDLWVRLKTSLDLFVFLKIKNCFYSHFESNSPTGVVYFDQQRSALQDVVSFNFNFDKICSTIIEHTRHSVLTRSQHTYIKPVIAWEAPLSRSKYSPSRSY